MRRFPERLHRGNWGYSSPEEVSGLSEHMLSWVFVTKSSPLCKGEGGNRVARICMSKESRKFEQFPVIVYMTLLKLPLAYLFFFLIFLLRELPCAASLLLHRECHRLLSVNGVS